MEIKLQCNECTKTNNHCCKADIPLEHITAGILLIKARKLGIDAYAIDYKDTGKVVLFDSKWSVNGEIDLEGKDCIFLKDGKCQVYEDRPDICRQYGTEYIRCRWEASGILPEQIKRATFDDIRFYDEEAMKKSLLYKENL